MSHRVVIINKLREAFGNEEVRASMTSTQCGKVDAILQVDEPNSQDFRELTHRLNRIYSQDD